LSQLGLRPFGPPDADRVLGWIGSAEEAFAWAGLRGRSLVPSLFAEWHADPDVHPYVLVNHAGPCGYGEVWDDPEEHEAELARIVVDPARRGRGIGRELVELLAADAIERGWDDVWVRVLPDNAPALACYRRAGFVAASDEEAASFNAGQPTHYVWMRLERKAPPERSDG